MFVSNLPLVSNTKVLLSQLKLSFDWFKTCRHKNDVAQCSMHGVWIPSSWSRPWLFTTFITFIYHLHLPHHYSECMLHELFLSDTHYSDSATINHTGVIQGGHFHKRFCGWFYSYMYVLTMQMGFLRSENCQYNVWLFAFCFASSLSFLQLAHSSKTLHSLVRSPQIYREQLCRILNPHAVTYISNLNKGINVAISVV